MEPRQDPRLLLNFPSNDTGNPFSPPYHNGATPGQNGANRPIRATSGASFREPTPPNTLNPEPFRDPASFVSPSKLPPAGLILWPVATIPQPNLGFTFPMSGSSHGLSNALVHNTDFQQPFQAQNFLPQNTNFQQPYQAQAFLPQIFNLQQPYQGQAFPPQNTNYQQPLSAQGFPPQDINFQQHPPAPDLLAQNLPGLRSSLDPLEPYKCQYCPKTYAGKDSLASHEATHMFEENVSEENTPKENMPEEDMSEIIKCRFCPKIFTSKKERMDHEKEHDPNRMNRLNRCRFCLRTFPSKAALQIHIPTHGDETPWPCYYPDCHRKYSCIQILNQHIQEKHSGMRPYACKDCKKSFALKGALSKHANLSKNCRPYKEQKHNSRRKRRMSSQAS